MSFPVRPGDLIQAADINALFDSISTLENRVAALESQTSGIVITLVNPVDEQRIGQIVEIIGRNLPDPGASTVLFGTTQATAFGTSNASIMRVEVPNVPNAPVDADITIRFGGEVATWPYHVLPAAANAPAPTSIVRTSNNSTVLRQNDGFTMTGTNLGPNPTVTFQPVTGGASQNVANPVVGQNNTQITGTVPDFGLATGQSSTFDIIVDVAGETGRLNAITVRG